MDIDQGKFVKRERTYLDLGLTPEDFLEIVDFFQELMRLDQKNSEKEKLVQVRPGAKS